MIESACSLKRMPTCLPKTAVFPQSDWTETVSLFLPTFSIIKCPSIQILPSIDKSFSEISGCPENDFLSLRLESVSQDILTFSTYTQISSLKISTFSRSHPKSWHLSHNRILASFVTGGAFSTPFLYHKNGTHSHIFWLILTSEKRSFPPGDWLWLSSCSCQKFSLQKFSSPNFGRFDFLGPFLAPKPKFFFLLKAPFSGYIGSKNGRKLPPGSKDRRFWEPVYSSSIFIFSSIF